MVAVIAPALISLVKRYLKKKEEKKKKPIPSRKPRFTPKVTEDKPKKYKPFTKPKKEPRELRKYRKIPKSLIRKYRPKKPKY